MGVVPPAPGFLGAPARARRRNRRAADPRRGHHRLPGRARWRPGAARRARRSHRDGQDHRRRLAGRRLRRSAGAARADRARPATSTRRGRLSGQPARGRGGARDAAQLDAAGVRAARGRHGGTRRRPARSCGERRPRPDRAVGPGPRDAVLQFRGGAATTPARPRATPMRTARGAASCSRAGSIRRRRSSRRGSRRSPTPMPTCEATGRAPRRAAFEAIA